LLTLSRLVWGADHFATSPIIAEVPDFVLSQRTNPGSCKFTKLCVFVNKGTALKECKFAQAAVNMTSQFAEFIPFRQSNTVIAVTNVSILWDY
jgi:hypothetical protein